MLPDGSGISPFVQEVKRSANLVLGSRRGRRDKAVSRWPSSSEVVGGRGKIVTGFHES